MEGGIWDDGVNGQRKMRGEARDVGVVENHGAHVVVSNLGKACDRSLFTVGSVWLGYHSHHALGVERRKEWWAVIYGVGVYACGFRCSGQRVS